MQTNSELTGLEKASVLLMSLDSEASEEILQRLSPEERNLLGAQIVRMRSVKSVVRERVLGEVSQAVRSGMPDKSGPFRWLESYDPDRAADLLAGERPHTIAVVLSHLSPGTVASVLGCFDERTRNAVSRGLAQIAHVPEDVAKTIDELMRKRALSPSRGSASRMVVPALRSLSETTARARESMMAAISRTHPAATMLLAPEIESLEDLTRLPAAQVREMLGDADLDDLCLSLRVASEELKSVILRNVSSPTASLLRERLETTAQIRVREIEIAQQRVVAALRLAARSGGLAEAAVE